MDTLEKHLDKWQPEPNTGCYLWSGTSDSKGYARLKEGGKGIRVIRRVLEEKCGPAPHSDDHASHMCDTSACINPAHLRWETPEQNNERRKGTKRGTAPRGNKWAAYARKDGKQIYLGLYDLEIDAHHAYLRHYGKLPPLQIPKLTDDPFANHWT